MKSGNKAEWESVLCSAESETLYKAVFWGKNKLLRADLNVQIADKSIKSVTKIRGSWSDPMRIISGILR